MFADLRHAARMLRKNPGFTLVAVLSLSLGIGATTTIFCWIQNVILYPLPGVAHQERMVVLQRMQGDSPVDTVNLPTIKDTAELTDVFAGVIGSQVTPACLTVGGQPMWLYGQIATSNFFEVLGVKPILGRTFAVTHDDTLGGQPVIVLSEDCWRRRFGADPGVINRTIELNRHSFTIIGVTPAAFRGTMGGLQCDFWTPVEMCREVTNTGSLDSRWGGWLHTQARLQPGVSIQRAQVAVNALMSRLEVTYPDSHREVGTRILPMWRAPYGAQALLATVLQVLFAVSVFVLLIVVANVANLFLARAIARRREIAIRIAAGAGRRHILRQLLTESLLLSFLGGIGGVLLTFWASDLLRFFAPNTPLPVANLSTIDAGTLAFGLAVALGTGIVFGIVPAVQASHWNTNDVLKEGGRSSSGGPEQHRLRAIFVISEIALAMMLTVGAGLCIRGTMAAQQIPFGFDPDHVVIAGLRIGMNGYDETSGIAFYERLQRSIEAQPGVKSAALASWLPLGLEGGPGTGIQVPGYERKPGEDTTVDFAIVSPAYFETLRVPLAEGREFAPSDNREDPPAAIINEAMAKRFWPVGNPVGHEFHAWNRTFTITGVAKTGKYRSLAEQPKPFVYFCYLQGVPELNLNAIVRTTGDPRAFVNTLREQIRELDPAVDVWASLPMEEYVAAAFFAQDLALGLLITLGVVALALSAIGIFAVMAHTVSQRTQEIGVRMALGARAGDVLRLIIAGGLRLAGAGLLIGVAGGFAVTRLLSGFLYGVSPVDLTVYLTAGVLVLGATVLACWIPARRAARVDPLVALHAE